MEAERDGGGMQLKGRRVACSGIKALKRQAVMRPVVCATAELATKAHEKTKKPVAQIIPDRKLRIFKSETGGL